jgi:hypothetical protein
MKKIKITISDGKNRGSFTLDPLTQIRFMAYADVNSLNLSHMLERLVLFGTVHEEEEQPNLSVPDWSCLRNVMSTLDDDLRWTRRDEVLLEQLGQQ